VVHVPFTFAPDPVGGTEVYVESLARGLRGRDIQTLIAAPSANGIDEAYDYNGLQIRRFRSASNSKQMLRELYGGGDAEAGNAFAELLDKERVDAVHLHGFTRAVSIRLVRAAKKRRLPVFFTYHTPTVSCQRGTMMLHGKEACDGTLMVRRCTGCWFESQGVPRWFAVLSSCLPIPFERALGSLNLKGGIWTALRTPGLIRARQEAFNALMREVDGVVALGEWGRALLARNGVPCSKIIVSRHGMPETTARCGPLVDVVQIPLRVAFIGRADSAKGADTLIKAVRLAPELNIELHLYGLQQSAADEAYWALLKSIAAHDRRITFLPPVPHDNIVSLLRGYHVLAVPSRWLETGPLVVLESFFAGTPVIGSNLGGIAERVHHEKNGLLVRFDDVQGWTDALRRCAEDRDLMTRLRAGIHAPRSMGDVAEEMEQMYHRHVEPKSDFSSTSLAPVPGESSDGKTN
jgi:glycosyltransferase involved in cell wall biosynthesis